MKKVLLIAFLLVSLLQGCAFDGFFRKKDPPIIPEVPVKLDPRVLEPCIPLVTIQAANPEYLDILTNIEANTKIYSDCASKQDNSIKLLKQFGGIK